MINKVTVNFYKILFIILLLFTENFIMCFGQQKNNFNAETDINNMKENVKVLFYNSDCTYGPLVNGRLYTDNYPGVMGHQYLLSKVWENGVVYLRGDVQKELLINYDIVSDKLIWNKFHSDGAYSIELNINDIEGFSIGGHKFIKLSQFEGLKEAKGYYEVLYDGKVKLLLKWEKYISKVSNLNKDISYLENTFYIKNKNKLVKVNKRRSIISSLSDHAGNIEKYMKQKKFYVRTARPEDFVELLKYYDSL